MCFVFTCGSHDFSKALKGYENMRVQCPRCHNASVVAIKQRTFFTFCFVPIFPLHWGEELRCTICQYHQETSPEQLNNMQAGIPPGGGPPPPQQQPQYK